MTTNADEITRTKALKDIVHCLNFIGVELFAILIAIVVMSI